LFIPGFTFPVTEHFKNDFEIIAREQSLELLAQGTDLQGEMDEEDGRDWTTSIGGNKKKGDIDYDLLIRLLICLTHGVRNCENASMLRQANGAILVFMPGVPEISKLIRLLESCRRALTPSTSRLVVTISALHGNLTSQQQQAVFIPARKNELKIVVATNVAEASVTIPDVTVVVDSCRVKEVDFDPEAQLSALIMKFASHDSLRQRRGRAGRVQVT